MSSESSLADQRTPLEKSSVLIRIVALAAGVNVLSYTDRVCISLVAPRLQSDLALSPTQMGMVFGAFSLSYALLQAPWGLIADKYGSRRVVALAILAWSMFTGLTAAAWSFASMIVVRLLFGVSEAAISPAIASAFWRLIPTARRSTAFGAFLAGGRIGGAIAPYITVFFTLRYGWRAMFLIFAAFGVFAMPVWFRGVPHAADRPRMDELKSKTSLRAVVSVPLVALLIVSFSYTVMWQFYVTWFPTYLVDARGFNIQQAATYTSLPFLLGLFTSWIGGILGDAMARWLGLNAGRLIVGVGALLISALFLWLGLAARDRSVAAILISLAAGAGDLLLGTSWALAVDIGGRAAGAVAGLTNSASNLGALLSPVAIGWMLQHDRDWGLILRLLALCNVFAAIFWAILVRQTARTRT